VSLIDNLKMGTLGRLKNRHYNVHEYSFVVKYTKGVHV
jgi:hypothetical protein